MQELRVPDISSLKIARFARQYRDKTWSQSCTAEALQDFALADPSFEQRGMTQWYSVYVSSLLVHSPLETTISDPASTTTYWQEEVTPVPGDGGSRRYGGYRRDTPWPSDRHWKPPEGMTTDEDRT